MASVTFSDVEIDALAAETAAAWHRLIAPTILATMRRECPVDLGLLQQQHAIDPMVKTGPRSYLVRFRALPYYGVYVHEGHGVIVPKFAKALRFVTKGGKVVFTKRVKAVPANPWMWRALKLCGFDAVRTFK